MIGIRVSFAIVCVLIACACKPASSPPPSSLRKNAGTTSNWVTAITNKSARSPLECLTNGGAFVRLTILEIPSEDDAGLAQFLASTVASDPVSEILQRSDVYQMAQTTEGISLTTNTPRMSLGIASPTAASNFLASATNAIVLTNSMRLGFGLEGLMSRGNVMTVMTTRGPLPVTLDRKAQLWICQPSATNYSVRASFAISDFFGYLPSKTPTPLPAFHINVFSIETEFPTNNILVMASKPHPTYSRYSHRTPLLSAIPAVGNIFTRSGVETNWVRTLILMDIQQ
jgi:hypothetical protein